MEDNVLTKEQKEALGLEPEVKQPVEKKKNATTKTKLVDLELSDAEKAKQKMLATFGTVGTDEVPDTQVLQTEVNLEDLLAGLTIDVSKIEIADAPSTSAINDKSIVINGRPTFEAVCNQSGYTAYVHSLKYSDLSSLENSVGGFYAGRQRLYKTIYDKLNTTSIGKVSFEDFLKMTSLYDVPSLLYGIYCQTFKTEVEFTVSCPHCKQEMQVKVANKALMTIKNKEIYDNVQKILGKLSTPEEVIAQALVNNRTKLVLPTSKMIFEFKIPTLYKYLDTIGSIKPEDFDKMEDILGMMVFVDKIFKLDVAALVKTKKVVYYEVKEKEEIAKIISNLELEDSTEVTKLISAETEKYAISYAIKGLKCRQPKCKKAIGDIPVDMEELTFFRIKQM